MIKKYFQKSKGFTYIELIVVVSVFGMIAVVITSTFVLFTNAQSKTATREVLIADVRNIMEVISREVHNGKIDYSEYGERVQNPVSELYLLDREEKKILIRQSVTDCPGKIKSCVIIMENESLGYLSSGNTTINNISFYITPQSDPSIIDSSGSFLSNEQPAVTVSLEASSFSQGSNENIELRVQTTLTSKHYAR